MFDATEVAMKYNTIWNIHTQTVLWSLCIPTCVSWHPSWELDDFVGANVLLPSCPF